MSLLFKKRKKKKNQISGFTRWSVFTLTHDQAPATRVRINKIISHHSAPSSHIFHEKCKKNNLARDGTIYWPSRFWSSFVFGARKGHLCRTQQQQHLQAPTIDILFRQITTLIKVHVAFIFGLQTLWLICRFFFNLSIKWSGAQKQRPKKLLWTLWFDEKIYLLRCRSSSLFDIKRCWEKFVRKTKEKWMEPSAKRVPGVQSNKNGLIPSSTSSEHRYMYVC